MEALRRSALYLRLYRKLDHLFHHYEIDQLRVEQNGVTVTSVMPAHTLLTFDFKQKRQQQARLLRRFKTGHAAFI